MVEIPLIAEEICFNIGPGAGVFADKVFDQFGGVLARILTDDLSDGKLPSRVCSFPSGVYTVSAI